MARQATGLAISLVSRGILCPMVTSKFYWSRVLIGITKACVGDAFCFCTLDVDAYYLSEVLIYHMGNAHCTQLCLLSMLSWNSTAQPLAQGTRCCYLHQVTMIVLCWFQGCQCQITASLWWQWHNNKSWKDINIQFIDISMATGYPWWAKILQATS